MSAADPRPIRESLQSTHPSLSTARIPTPPSRLDPYPRKRPITSRFPIDIATPLDLASDSSDCTSGPTAPTDVTLPSCPTSLPLLYSPDPFPTESHLSRVQCSVSLVFPSSGLFPFSTISLSLPSATALFQCSHSRHYPIPFSVRYTPLSFRLALYLFFPPILHALPVFIVRPSIC